MSDFCFINMIFIFFNKFCPHIKLIDIINDKYTIQTPLAGRTAFNKSKNISHLDVYYMIHSKYYRENVFKCCEHCHQTINRVINHGNNIYELKFNENIDHDEYERSYNYMLNRIVNDKNPYDDEIDIDMEVLTIREPFNYDINTKYCFT